MLSAGQKIRVSAGKPIYSDAGTTRIKYSEADVTPVFGENAGVATLDASTKLVFIKNTDIEVISGNILLPDENRSLVPRVRDLGTIK